jgi:eukaryotic-like serine/threonine-protein kinase
MGEVYRARDTRLQRDVAIKVLPQATAHDPSVLARFRREAQVIAALQHPSILALYDVGVECATTFAVMELLEGETPELRTRLHRTRRRVRNALHL